MTSGLVGLIRAAWIDLARFPYSSIHTCAYDHAIELPDFFWLWPPSVCLVRTTPVFMRLINQCLTDLCGNRGKTPGRFGDRPYRSAFGCQKTAELRALRSDGERLLHLRARTFAPHYSNQPKRIDLPM